MNYKDFEILNPNQTIPVAAGSFTTGMGITLVMFLIAVGVLTTLIVQRRKARKEKAPLPGGKHWGFTAGGMLLVAAISAGAFTLEAITPDQQKIEAAHNSVQSNYDELFSSYGLNTPEHTEDLEIGKVVAATHKNGGAEVVVKITIQKGEVVLTNLAGGKYLADAEEGK